MDIAIVHRHTLARYLGRCTAVLMLLLLLLLLPRC